MRYASVSGRAPVLAIALTLVVGLSPAAGAADATEPAVLVELFTSQGCSSCPAADRLLSKLARENRVIALAFHVDYWNYIGWTDPFSSAAWSQRQRGYGAVFEAGRIYTPQLVVNGRWEGVGSDPVEVGRMIRRAAESLTDEVRLEIEGDGDAVTVGLTVRPGRDAPLPRRAWLAVAESGFETPVGKGENARRTLVNDNVVRRLEPVELEPGQGEARAAIDLEIDPAWKRENLQLVAFLQEPETMAITGAAQARLP